jgi:hypothetical protein
MLDVRTVSNSSLEFGLSLSNKSLGRFAISLLATCLDVAVVYNVGSIVSRCASFSFALPAAFAVLVLGMIASLGWMWSLTIRDTDSQLSIFEPAEQVPEE